jgi:type VI secretion system protein ImpK
MRTLLCDTAYQITLLEQGVIPDSLKELRDDCEELIGTFEAALIAHQVEADVIWDAVHAQCVILDETVARNLPAEMQALWGKAPLQIERFHHGDGSERIFERIATRMQAATPELALLECYSTLLGLGGQGCHAGSGKTERAALVTALDTRIAALHRATGQNPQRDATEKIRPYWLSMLPSWIVTTLTAAAIVLLYLLLNHALDPELYTMLQLPSSTLHR